MWSGPLREQQYLDHIFIQKHKNKSFQGPLFKTSDWITHIHTNAHTWGVTTFFLCITGHAKSQHSGTSQQNYSKTQWKHLNVLNLSHTHTLTHSRNLTHSRAHTHTHTFFVQRKIIHIFISALRSTYRVQTTDRVHRRRTRSHCRFSLNPDSGLSLFTLSFWEQHKSDWKLL